MKSVGARPSSWGVALVAVACLCLGCGDSANGAPGRGGATANDPGQHLNPPGEPAEGSLGAACVPSQEDLPSFSGFTVNETDLNSEHPVCAKGTCLAHKFVGRVTCPYGQTEEALSLAPESTERCKTPSGQAVDVEVEPQRLERRPDHSVFCSCRCAGPDPEADYCDCPSFMQCEPLVEDLGLGLNDVAGSYCVYPETLTEAIGPKVCERQLQNCE